MSFNRSTTTRERGSWCRGTISSKEESKRPRAEYEHACAEFLNRSLTTRQTEDEARTIRNVLSNPMDLTIAAELIASGNRVDVHGLMQQYYDHMADDYRRRYHADFPLANFSEWVNQRCITNETRLTRTKQADFTRELEHLEHHKMVVPVPAPQNGQATEKSWEFRHDKIREYFLAQAFLGDDNPLPDEYLADARYRGVYFLLADLMPLAKAETLREKLVNHAADSGDHSVSDNFIRRLRARRTRRNM